MSRLLALEWDQNEARVAVAQAHGGQAVIEHAFAVQLPATAGNGSDTSDLAARLSAALADRGIDRRRTLVAVGRANIELKLMSLPPAPASELPELVRFQAQRQFNSLEDDWPLDFITLSGDENTPHSVLAAAISAELVEQIVATCRSVDLRPRRLALRPCAAASLLRRSARRSGERVRLLVDPLVEEADLTALVEDDVVFIRTVRLPTVAHEAARRQTLLGEIRRTVAAVQNQLGGDRVDAIYICGEQGDEDEWAGQLRDELGHPTHVFPPFSGLQLGAELSRKLPDHAARFAPLLGMLLDEADDSHQAIDFLHPRQKPKARDNRRTIAIAASIAALLLIAYVGNVWFGLSRLDDQIAATKGKVEQLKGENESHAAARDQTAEIEQWLATDVIWLDKLHMLSERYPPSKDAMVTKLIFGIGRDQTAGGVVELDGVVRDWDVMNVIESQIPIEAKGGSDDDTHKQYPQRFSARIDVQTGPEDDVPGTEGKRDAAGVTAPPEDPTPDDPPAEEKPMQPDTDGDARPAQPDVADTDGEGGQS
jgi:Tfp pilus assembly PilM family ATPase